MTAALKREGDRDRQELDALAARIIRDRRFAKVFTEQAIRKAAEATSSPIWGTVSLLEKTFCGDLLSDATEQDAVRVADRILRRMHERALAEQSSAATSPTAERLRSIVEERGAELRREADARRVELDEARKTLEAATKHVAEYDQPAHRQKMREAAEEVSVREARFSGASAQLAEHQERLRKNRKRFDLLIRKATAGSGGDWLKRNAAREARLRDLLVEVFHILGEMRVDVHRAQKDASEAIAIAEECGIPRIMLTPMRPPDLSSVKALVMQAGKVVLSRVGLTGSEAIDLLDPRTWRS